MDQATPLITRHSAPVISHLPVFSLPPAGITIIASHIYYLSPIVPFLPKKQNGT